MPTPFFGYRCMDEAGLILRDGQPVVQQEDEDFYDCPDDPFWGRVVTLSMKIVCKEKDADKRAILWDKLLSMWEESTNQMLGEWSRSYETNSKETHE